MSANVSNIRDPYLFRLDDIKLPGNMIRYCDRWTTETCARAAVIVDFSTETLLFHQSIISVFSKTLTHITHVVNHHKVSEHTATLPAKTFFNQITEHLHVGVLILVMFAIHISHCGAHSSNSTCRALNTQSHVGV
jgi:hypothetical protein